MAALMGHIDILRYLASLPTVDPSAKSNKVLNLSRICSSLFRSTASIDMLAGQIVITCSIVLTLLGALLQVDLQPLHCACQAGQTEAVKVLIGEFQVNPNATAEVASYDTLQFAAESGETICSYTRAVSNQSTLQL